LNKKKYKVIIYTDGSSIGNPGPGGFGIVLIAAGRRKEIAKGYRLTTNNRMELLSVIIALEALKYDNCEVTIYSDSKYVVDAVGKGWVFSWEKKYFKKKENSDLWKRFLKIYPKHKIKFKWIKGHADNRENERCDFLANQAAKTGNLCVDEYYEAKNKDQNKLF